MDQQCFNQKYNSLVLATPTEYRLFYLDDIDTTLRVRHIFEKANICLIGGLWDESIFAMVVESNPQQIILWDLIRKMERSNYIYPTPILSVKLSRKTVVVLLEGRILIHNIRDIKSGVKTQNIPSNPRGIWDFANRSEHFAFVAYKYYRNDEEKNKGKIQVFDTKSVSPQLNMGKVISTFMADDKPLAAICFSPTGTEIATVNTLGTVIRIFSSNCGSKLMELRRGHTGASISALLFSTCGKYLVSASNKKTVHVYHVKLNDKDEDATLGKAVRSILPSFICQDRAFATVSLPIAGSGRAFGIAQLRGKLRLMVGTSDGTLHVYSIPIASGEECDIVARYNLLEDSLKMTFALPASSFIIDDDTPSTSAAASRSIALRALASDPRSPPPVRKSAYEEEDLFAN